MPRIQDLITYFSPMQARLIAAPNGGWSNANPAETAAWAYVSANSIGITGADATNYYQVGCKARFKQGGSYKYFYVTSVTSSQLTLFGGTDYTVANAAITDNEISFDESPLGFPGAFNYDGAPTGFSANPSGALYRFTLKGKKCFVNVRMPNNGTSNSTGFTVAAPITSANIANQFWGAAWWTAANNGAALTAPGRVYLGSNSTTITVERDYAGTAWTNANGKKADFQFWYEIAS